MPYIESLQGRGQGVGEVNSRGDARCVTCTVAVLDYREAVRVVRLCVRIGQGNEELERVGVRIILRHVFRMICVVFVERRIAKAVFRRSNFVVRVSVRGVDGFEYASACVGVHFLVGYHVFRSLLMPIRVEVGVEVRVVSHAVCFFVEVRRDPYSLVNGHFVMRARVDKSIGGFQFLDQDVCVTFWACTSSQSIRIASQFYFGSGCAIYSADAVRHQYHHVLRCKGTFGCFEVRQVRIHFKCFGSVRGG